MSQGTPQRVPQRVMFMCAFDPLLLSDTQYFKVNLYHDLTLVLIPPVLCQQVWHIKDICNNFSGIYTQEWKWSLGHIVYDYLSIT